MRDEKVCSGQHHCYHCHHAPQSKPFHHASPPPLPAGLASYCLGHRHYCGPGRRAPCRPKAPLTFRGTTGLCFATGLRNPPWSRRRALSRPLKPVELEGGIPPGDWRTPRGMARRIVTAGRTGWDMGAFGRRDGSRGRGMNCACPEPSCCRAFTSHAAQCGAGKEESHGACIIGKLRRRGEGPEQDRGDRDPRRAKPVPQGDRKGGDSGVRDSASRGRTRMSAA